MAGFPRILHLHHSVCCNSTPLWNIWMNVSLPWTLCTQMQDQSGHGPETNSSIFRHNVETLPIWSGWFSAAQAVPQTKTSESFHGSFSWNGTRSFIVSAAHYNQREHLSGFDQRWQWLCGNEPRLWKAAMSVNQPSVESWTRASRSQVTRTEIYVFINAIYFGSWFGMSEFIIFLHIKTDVQVLAE